MEKKVIRYDELKKGMIVIFHGAKLRIEDVREFPYKGEYFKDETDKVINFDVSPYDQDSIDQMGNFYSHGTYGGVGCLTITQLIFGEEA